LCNKNLGFIDAYNAVFIKHYGVNEVFSYDADFDAIEGIKREEP
jgi:predicted nucleic acid-binding protein